MCDYQIVPKPPEGWLLVVFSEKLLEKDGKLYFHHKKFLKKQNFLLKKQACCAIFICGKAIY